MDKTISLCMLVKNEEKNIDRVLSNIHNLFNEIIIVDTGSVDKTLEKVEKYTKNIYNFEINDDFSIARNYLISKAKSDYIFILDSDEEIDPKYVIKLREILNFYENKDVYFLNVIENLNGVKSQELQARVFKNIPQIKYKYSVYENIYDSIEENKLSYLTLNNIIINHFKYENIERVESTSVNSIRILENELNKNDLDIEQKSYYILKLINIYTTYYFVGYEPIVKLISEFFEISKNNIFKNSLFIPRNLIFNTYLIGLLFQKEDFDKMEEICNNIYKFYPNSLNILYYLFICSLNKNNKVDALNYANKIKNLIVNKSYFKFETLILDYINEQVDNFISELKPILKTTKNNLKNKVINSNIRISLCILVLDSNINNNLEKILDFFDDVIIVTTKNLSKDYYHSDKIKIFKVEFDNNISELKNFALSLASGEYILFLNSYEYMSEEDINKLNQDSYNPILYALNVNILEYDDNNNLLDVNKEIRFFRNDNKIYFYNRIYETPDYSIYNEVNNNFLSIKDSQEINIIKIFSEERERNKLELINISINYEEDLLFKIFLYYKKFIIEKYFNYKNAFISLFEAFKLLEKTNLDILSFDMHLSKFLIDISSLIEKNNKNNEVLNLYKKNMLLFPWEYKTYQKMGELCFENRDFINSSFLLSNALKIINNNPLYKNIKPKYVTEDILKIEDILNKINKQNDISLITFNIKDKEKEQYKNKFENIFVVNKSVNEVLNNDIISNYFIVLKNNENIIFSSDKLSFQKIIQKALVKIEYHNLIWYEDRLISINYLKENNIPTDFIIFDTQSNNNDRIDNILIKTLNNPYDFITKEVEFNISDIKSLIYYENLMGKFLNDNNLEKFEELEKLLESFDNIPSIYYKAGIKFLKRENYKEAIKKFHKCIELGSEGNFYPYIPFDKGILSYLSMYQIGICYLKQGKKQLAKIFFDQATEENENFEEAKRELENLSN